MQLPGIIYIIDDDPDDIDFMIEAIASVDSTIRCYSALNGEDGLRQLFIGAIPYPALILLDLNMPRVNGREFLERIKENEAFCTIPVVMYSTSNMDRERNEYKLLGAAGFLVKPTRLSILTEMLRDIFAHLPQAGNNT